jgi:ABC-type Fe3+ transport system permease subunit
MSAGLAFACGWSLARSAIVALLAVPVCIWMRRRLAMLSRPARRAAWGVLVLPFLFPTLLSGYAYSSVSLQLVSATWWDWLAGSWSTPAHRWLAEHNSAMDEVLLGLLLLTRAVPVGTMLLAFAPLPSYSPAAWHCRGMLSGRPRSVLSLAREQCVYLCRGPFRSLLAAAGLMFLTGFQEFELPSLLTRPAWTVWLFDAQVGGLAIADSLQATEFPLICQAVVVIPLWYALANNSGGPAGESDAVTPGRWAGARDAGYLLAATVIACIVPLFLIGRGTIAGLHAIRSNSLQWERALREIAVGTAFALLSAIIAFRAAEAIGWRRSLVIFALPGLFGSLVLGLALVRLFQWPPLNVLYRTPVSLLMGMVLFLLPRAMLLQAVVQATRPAEARHAARLLADAPPGNRRAMAHTLAWRLGGSMRYWSVALLSFWGYLELTVAYLLGPVTIVSVPVLLYNQMHFGKNAVLSAMTCLAVAVPALSFLGIAALRPLLYRWFRR